MPDNHYDFFTTQNHFKETEKVESIPVFENTLKHTPRFTIAIPTYKRAKYLRETLESALYQTTDEPYEIIVADNNPERNDETELLMRQYKDRSGLSFYKQRQNIGMTGNWNRLVELTKTEYFILLHDDDCISPDFIRTITQFLRMKPHAAAIHTAFAQSADDYDIDIIDIKYHRLHLIDYIWGNVGGAPTGSVYKKDVLVQLGGWDNGFFPSTDYYFDAVLSKRYPVYKIDHKLTFYRWEINASLKPEIQQQFREKDSIIIDNILHLYGLPRPLRKKYLKVYFSTRHWTSQSISKSDIGTLSFFDKAGYNLVAVFTRVLRNLNKLFIR